jgi:hypothetical protein
VRENGDEYSAWSVPIPTEHARSIFTFDVKWGWEDGNICGDNTAAVNLPQCGIDVVVTRGDPAQSFSCDVSSIAGGHLAINKPNDSGCEYVIIGNPKLTHPVPVPFDGVKGHQKISQVDGGFNGVLADEDHFGSSIASIGDLDGDNVLDLAVGARGDSDGGGAQSYRGAVWILFLNHNGTVKAHQKISDTAGGLDATFIDGGEFGRGVASIADIDKDGVNDLAVGGKLADAVYILLLKTDGTVKHYGKISVSGPIDSSLFGVSLAAVNDLDGDNVVDLAVGAKNDDDGGDNRGAVWIMFLQTDGNLKAEQKISGLEGGFEGVLADFDHFGSSVALINDLDGDGVPEIAVGAPQYGSGETYQGAVYILFLTAAGTVKSFHKIPSEDFDGTAISESNFGSSLASAGDLDGDSTNDLVVGAPGAGAWILFLETTGTVRSFQMISDAAVGFEGAPSNAYGFGRSHAVMADLDGDTVSDLVVGEWKDPGGTGTTAGVDRGAIWILFFRGSGSGVSTASPTASPSPSPTEVPSAATPGAFPCHFTSCRPSLSCSLPPYLPPYLPPSFTASFPPHHPPHRRLHHTTSPISATTPLAISHPPSTSPPLAPRHLPS